MTAPSRPKLEPGDWHHAFTVVRVLGFGKRPTKYNKIECDRRTWWYEMRCQCGVLMCIPQARMRDKKACPACMKKERTPLRWETPPEHLDFARLRWVDGGHH